MSRRYETLLPQNSRARHFWLRQSYLAGAALGIDAFSGAAPRQNIWWRALKALRHAGYISFDGVLLRLLNIIPASMHLSTSE